jgi:hypothetical protein
MADYNYYGYYGVDITVDGTVVMSISEGTMQEALMTVIDMLHTDVFRSKKITKVAVMLITKDQFDKFLSSM